MNKSSHLVYIYIVTHSYAFSAISLLLGLHIQLDPIYVQSSLLSFWQNSAPPAQGYRNLQSMHVEAEREILVLCVWRELFSLCMFICNTYTNDFSHDPSPIFRKLLMWKCDVNGYIGYFLHNQAVLASCPSLSRQCPIMPIGVKWRVDQSDEFASF